MGSRAVVVVCRNEKTAQTRFGINNEAKADGEKEIGIVYTRTGRRFFHDRVRERALLDRLVASMESSGFWETFQTDWVCLDCELMPWSAKAHDLLKNQYAAVGSAARQSLPSVVNALELAQNRFKTIETDANDPIPIDSLLDRFKVTQSNADRFVEAYRQYCWKVDTIEDLKLAPFHILATENAVHVDKDHHWHMTEIAKFCNNEKENNSLLMATDYKEVDLNSLESEQAAIDWWLELTESGGEGMVVKSLDFISKGKKGLNQPAVKCRGREYLRIIYGPDYNTEKNLTRLRNRHLGRKRSLAIREFALGIESLERFVDRQPLRKVHECVFGVLALESEPVDPRL